MIQSVFVRRVVHIGGALVWLLVAGCERPLDPEICPQIGVGDLVISELRGKQPPPADVEPPPPEDNQGEWMELYNAGGGTLDLYGLAIVLRKLDGSSEGLVRVRRSLTVAAGDRVVLSFYTDDARAPHTDYGWFPDFPDSAGEAQSIFDSGVIDVESCGLRIDRVVVDLPSSGTLALGVEPPSAAANDDAAMWCNDTTPESAPTIVGMPGTPGASNNPCVTP